MSKYTRITGKLFGANATATGNEPEIGQFGSALAGTYRGTTDVATIQNLPAWGKGYIGAVVPNMQYPPLPEVTGVLKVLSYQQNYLLQNGIPEWDSTTDYYINSFCSQNGIIYKSLTDNNINNVPSSSPQHWTENIFNGANKDLSNLTTYGNNRLHALKGYLDNGELLTDREGWNDVISYAHSLYNSSAFELAGTLNIDNGIVSGFGNTGNNYIYSTGKLPSNYNTFEIYLGRYNFSELTANDWMLSNSNNLSPQIGGFQIRTNIGSSSYGTKFLLWLGTGTTSWDIASSVGSLINHANDLNKNIELKLTFNGSQYVLSSKVDDANWQAEITVTDSTKIAGNLPFYIGNTATPHNFNYDAKYFKIIADNQLITSGNVTGIDEVKPVNYTPVGSPIITDDGIATFAANKYITLPEIDVTGKTFEIDFGKITPNNVTTTQDIISGISSNLLTVGIAGSSSRFFAVSKNWIGSIITDPLTANNTYYLKAGYDGSNAYLSLSTDGINYTKTTVELTSQFTTLSLRIGTQYNGATPILFPYDLNQFKIYVENKLVYQPCLLIPYAKSSTDSKIVYSYYRDRVVDVYNQKGKAGYFTLSDSDFTLPMGEIYGMMNPQTTEAPKIKNYGIIEHGSLTKSGNIISGFSTSNYGEIPNVFAPANNPWEINCKFTTGNDVTTTIQALIAGLSNHFGPIEFQIRSGKFWLALSSGTSSLDITDGVSGSHELDINTTYFVKIKFTGSQYIVSYSTDGTTYTNDISVTSSTSIYASRIGLGIDYGLSGQSVVYRDPFLGSIDLSGWNILINDVLFWQDSTPLDNVYPTSMKPAVVVDAYIKNNFGYRLWSDKRFEQWGVSYYDTPYIETVKFVVTLLEPFIDINYELQLTAGTGGRQETPDTGHIANEYYYDRTKSSFSYTIADPNQATTSGILSWKATGYIQ